jgi:hypothetical protein
MKLNEATLAETIDNEKLKRELTLLNRLIDELNKRELPEDLVTWINERVDWINQLSDDENSKSTTVRKYRSRILMRIEKDHKLVPKNYYRNLWLSLGIGAFGVPLGVAFGASINNYGFIGIFMPIGMAIGYAVGSNMDKRAAKENRQLDVNFG